MGLIKASYSVSKIRVFGAFLLSMVKREEHSNGLKTNLRRTGTKGQGVRKGSS